MAVALRDSTERSLIMLDEIGPAAYNFIIYSTYFHNFLCLTGKGTSSRDGASIAVSISYITYLLGVSLSLLTIQGAILEYLDSRGINGIFATHLHEIFQLPLNLKRVVQKRMGFRENDEGQPQWTYKLLDGRCTDSMALQTAQRFGVPFEILTRAKDLALRFDEECRGIRKQLQPHSHPKVLSEETILEEHQSSIGRENTRIHNEKKSAHERKYDLKQLLPYIQAFYEMKRWTIVETGYEPPVNYEGKHVLYILHIQRDQEIPDSFYVGETASIRQRLRQHRKSSNFGGFRIAALIVLTPDRTTARHLETQTILSLKKNGFDVERASDETTRLF